MMLDVKVSIIIPAYNVEKYIDKCVRSAINQTLKQIEIIVVNDGATDNTRCLIEKLVALDNRVVLVNQTNGGLSSARNSGIDISRGKFILHLDGDDWISETACEELYIYATDNELDLVVCDYFKNSEAGLEYYCNDWFNDNQIVSGEIALSEFFANKIRPSIWSKFIKSKLYENVRHPLHVTYGEDLATTPLLLLKSNRVGKYSKAFVHYRYNEASITKNKVYLRHSELFDAFEHIEKFIISDPDYARLNIDFNDLKAYHYSSIFLGPCYWGDEEFNVQVGNTLNFLRKSKGLSVIGGYTLWSKLIIYIIFLLPFTPIVWGLMSFKNLVKK